jgi:hypothetical protein
MIFFCVGVMYSGEYDACDVTLSVYPHRASLKYMNIFQACPVCMIYTQNNITSIMFCILNVHLFTRPSWKPADDC